MTCLIRGVLIWGVMLALGNFITPRIGKKLLSRLFSEGYEIRGSSDHTNTLSPPTYIIPLI